MFRDVKFKAAVRARLASTGEKYVACASPTSPEAGESATKPGTRNGARKRGGGPYRNATQTSSTQHGQDS